MFYGKYIRSLIMETPRLSVADASRASVESSDGKGITISLEVDDIQITHAYLKTAGLYPTDIRDHAWGAKVIYIHDPEGNRIKFWSGPGRCLELDEKTCGNYLSMMG